MSEFNCVVSILMRCLSKLPLCFPLASKFMHTPFGFGLLRASQHNIFSSIPIGNKAHLNDIPYGRAQAKSSSHKANREPLPHLYIKYVCVCSVLYISNFNIIRISIEFVIEFKAGHLFYSSCDCSFRSSSYCC